MLAAMALALAAPRSYVVYGPERIVTCAEWTATRGDTEGDQLDFWLMGFLTGYNYYSPDSDGDIGGGVGSQPILAWANHYCRDHPLDNQVQLARALIQELRRHKK